MPEGRRDGRWTNRTFVVGGSVVGTVSKGASGNWFAYGCALDWEDTPLHSFQTEDEAKKAVETWVEEHA